MKLANLAATYLTSRLQGSLFSLLAPVGPLVKQLSLGIGSFVIGLVSFLFALLFLALSFFFFLIDRGQWSISGFWTFLVLALIGLVFTLVGRSIVTDSKKHIR